MPPDEDDADFVVRRHDDVWVVRVKVPNLSSPAEVRRVREFVDGVIRRGARKLILDLKYVTLYGSQTLGMLVEISKDLNTRGGKLVLSHAEIILPALEQTKLLRLMAVAPDPKSAAKLFGDVL